MKIRFQLNVLVNKKDDNQADGYVTNGNHSFVAYVLREIDNAATVVRSARQPTTTRQSSRSSSILDVRI